MVKSLFLVPLIARLLAKKVFTIAQDTLAQADLVLRV